MPEPLMCLAIIVPALAVVYVVMKWIAKVEKAGAGPAGDGSRLLPQARQKGRRAGAEAVA